MGTKVSKIGGLVKVDAPDEASIIYKNLIQNPGFEEAGDDLVSNGNFEELGVNTVTNGSFTVDADWTKNSNWSIADGKATSNGSGGNLQQSGVLTPNEINTYLITYDIVDYVSGGVIPNIHGTESGTQGAAAGSHSTYITGVSSVNASLFFISNNFNGSITNVSVKQVDPNDRWTEIGSGVTITDKVNFDGSIATVDGCRQVGAITSAGTYEVTYTISDYSQGNFKMRVGGTYGNARTANGTYTETITALNFNFQLYGFENFIGSVDSVSLKKIDPNDRWILGVGWSIADGIASCDGTTGVSIHQVLDGVLDTVYKIEVTISNYVSGILQIGGSSNFLPASANGTFTFYRTWTADPNLYLKSPSGSASDGFIGSIDNITVWKVAKRDVTYINGYNFEFITRAEEVIVTSEYLEKAIYIPFSEFQEGDGTAVPTEEAIAAYLNSLIE